MFSTKEAIQTSILSKRWRFIWTSISTIILNDLDCCRIKDNHQRTIMVAPKMEIVDKIRSLHDTSDIKKLDLSFSVPLNFFRLNSWVRAAVKHNVQELNLYLTTKTQFKLPKWLFSCSSLITLHLRIPSILKTLAKINLPNLRKLLFSLTIFSDEVSLREFLLGYPVLEELSFHDCEWKNVKSVTLSLPTIRKLDVRHLPENADMYSEEIKISAVNLRTFDFLNDLYLNFKVCDLSSLNDASIDIKQIVEPLNEVTDRITNIVMEIYNVETLSMTDETLGFCFKCLNIVTGMQGIPTFHNLTQLELSTPFYAHNAKSLMELLKKTPKLELLNFSEGIDPDTYTSGIELTEEDVPSCFSSSLKMFSFSSSVAKKADMELISFVLKYAILLKSVAIYFNFDLSEDEVEEAEKKIKAIPRGSKRCVAEVIDI